MTNAWTPQTPEQKYELVLEASRSVGAFYREQAFKYRNRIITDKEFLEARAMLVESQKKVDEAEAELLKAHSE